MPGGGTGGAGVYIPIAGIDPATGHCRDAAGNMGYYQNMYEDAVSERGWWGGGGGGGAPSNSYQGGVSGGGKGGGGPSPFGGRLSGYTGSWFTNTDPYSIGNAGLPHSGGGGACGWAYYGFAGGSGIVIVRHLTKVSQGFFHDRGFGALAQYNKNEWRPTTLQRSTTERRMEREGGDHLLRSDPPNVKRD